MIFLKVVVVVAVVENVMEYKTVRTILNLN